MDSTGVFGPCLVLVVAAVRGEVCAPKHVRNRSENASMLAASCLDHLVNEGILSTLHRASKSESTSVSSLR